MAKAKEGDKVTVHYRGSLQDGTEFDSSYDREPFTFDLGSGDVIPGFEEAVLGMSPGDKATVEVPADKGYGQRRPELIIQLDRSQLPGDAEPEVGQQVELTLADGQKAPAQVVGVSDTFITLDGNHPLAGKDLSFTIELVEIGD